ncbi:ABC transporter permease [Pectobacterium carotovorum]|uniref:ABC transporter permease n=1 Tax=Pectobacterium carotovorum TaxID=554 RepID=UPI0004FFA42A|nr:ABC transporter permease [Pectobacterium carotovorum]KFX00892.1 ABC transporter permease [Pectobacterium carotovorum subsp. carotovorum]KHT35178.1 ABC transporter permease [Pectobacterium carotovorum subsp. carotovorum]KML70461.1 ABC transporter permease [Pectobacterium carotovorum subsp. carotovorum ICMP 5702]MBA0175688.1 ABC transporter permease [Pectobacterium carotovorum]MBA0180262.1 ABC transporter permease [Pectobacterium carotovorum]
MKPSSLAAQPALPGGRLGLSFFIRYGFLVILLAFLVFFSLQNPIFLTLGNWGNLLQGSAVLLIVALAMTLVVTAGGIDLSVGVALDFGAAFALVALKVYGLPWQAAVLAALAGGALVGLVNAVLIIHCRIKPFLATLGTWFIGSSIERIYTEGGGPIAYRRMAPQYHELAVGDLWGIPVPIVIVAVLWFAYYLLFERTIAGKRIHAMGLNAPAALIAGVNVRRTMFWLLIVTSVTCAIGGVVLSANLRQFTPLAGQAYLMDAIAAVFIGTAFHAQGRPNVTGTLIGVLFLGMIANGLNLMGLNFIVKDALSGVILVLALALSFLQGRLRQRQ